MHWVARLLKSLPPSDGMVILEGPTNAGLGGHASATTGDADGVWSFHGSIGLLAPGDGGIDGISRMIGQGSKVSSLDSIA